MPNGLKARARKRQEGRRDDRSGDRTHDLKIKSLLLYQLSYPVRSRRKLATKGLIHNLFTT